MSPSVGGGRTVGIGVPLNCLGLQAVILQVFRVEGIDAVKLDLGELSRRLVLNKILAGHLHESDRAFNKTVR